MITLMYAEKTFDKIHDPYLIKKSQQTRSRRELSVSNEIHLQLSYR